MLKMLFRISAIILKCSHCQDPDPVQTDTEKGILEIFGKTFLLGNDTVSRLGEVLYISFGYR